MFVTVSEISIFRIELNIHQNLNINYLLRYSQLIITVVKLQLLICKTIYC